MVLGRYIFYRPLRKPHEALTHTNQNFSLMEICQNAWCFDNASYLSKVYPSWSSLLELS